MSRRVGLRYMQSVGGKGLVCPEGEQFENGGFETGDTTGWTTTGTGGVSTSRPHTGTYSARTENQTFGLSQEFAAPIPVACFVAASVFEFYIYAYFSPSPPIGQKVDVHIKYTDGTETLVTWECSAAENGTWVRINLKPYLVAGKTVESIEADLDRRGLGLPWMYVDDFSLVC